MLKSALKKSTGFTLIELLLVIAVISVMSVVVFVALDPAKRLQDGRNARRTVDTETILTAIHQYIVDNKGDLPAGLSTTEKQLGTATSGCTISTGGCSVVATGDCVDMGTTLNKYLKAIPQDPKDGTASLTKYSVVSDANNIVTVRACGAEGTTIAASR